MKKCMALILALFLLIASAAAEESFAVGAQNLLESVDITRDRLTLEVNGPGHVLAQLSGTDGMLSMSLETEEEQFRAQFLEDQMYMSANGVVVNLKYADVQSLMQPGFDVSALPELIQLAVSKFVIGHTRITSENGLHISYRAEGSDLLEDVAEILDELLSGEQYAALIDQGLAFLSAASGQTLPSREQLAEQWPAIREQMLAQETDFLLAFDLTADPEFRSIQISAEAGPSDDRLLMNMDIASGRDSVKLDGKLTERISWSENVREYEILVTGQYRNGMWDFDIDQPDRMQHIHAEGSYLEGAGRFLMTKGRSGIGRAVEIQVNGSFSLQEDSASLQMDVVDRRRGDMQHLAVLVGTDMFDMCLTDYMGRKVFALRTLTDADELQYLSFASQGNSGNYSAVYEDGKLTVGLGDSGLITITGEEESDHVYVLTLHPEDPEAAGDAHVRLEYEGEEGSFVFRGSITDSGDKEIARAELVCESGEGKTEKLSDAENIIYLTPEVILSLLRQ